MFALLLMLPLKTPPSSVPLFVMGAPLSPPSFPKVVTHMPITRIGPSYNQMLWMSIADMEAAYPPE